MHRAEFEFICERLNSPKDAEKLHERMGYPFDMLFNILAKKIVRKTMRDFYRVKAKEALLVKRWNAGESILEIAKSMEFPPVLMAVFIFSKKGMAKTRVREMLCEPDKIRDPRVKKEIKAALEADFVYSPVSSSRQADNGRRGEGKLDVWLKQRDIPFMTEKDSRAVQRKKTPDFLFKKVQNIRGIKAHWIESKASFGDDREMKRDYKRQFQPYTEHFGIVVYWYGFLDDVHLDDKVVFVDSAFFDEEAPKKEKQ